ncbi:MAG: hypothetical protein LC649_02905 [Bacteroidales bacterium]|nr:hypothetical protein [Bacteroidales bacterium]
MYSIEFKSKVVTLSPKLYMVAIRLLQNEEEARDAVQEVMIKLWQRRRQLGSHPNPSGYACLATRNHCLDLLRKTEPSKAKEKQEVKIRFKLPVEGTTDTPVYIIDGRVAESGEIESISPNNIESITVRKDDESKKKYNSESGVILIVTKKKDL